MVLQLYPGYDIADVNDRWGTTSLDAIYVDYLHLVATPWLDDPEAYADSMIAYDPAIWGAEPNYVQQTPEAVRQMVVIFVGGSIDDFEDQGLVERIGLTQAHALATGAGVTVGIVDSGIDPDHEAFTGRVLPNGYDFVDEDTEPWEEADGIDNDFDFEIDEGYGHGTMVAGVVRLVAPDAEILPIRVLDDEGRSTVWKVAEGIRYAIDAGVDILNLSLGLQHSTSVITYQVQQAALADILVVGAAGNQSTENPAFHPASLPECVMVTALDSVDVKADFADWNQVVEISAPGTGVRSAFPGGEWAAGSGCSFATPFAVGSAALVMGADPTLSAPQVRQKVHLGVQDIYQLPGNEPYIGKLGSGRVWLPGALATVVGVAGPSADAPGLRGVAHPNPARGPVVLDWYGPAAGGLNRVELFDVTGRQVRAYDAVRLPLRWDGRTATGELVAPGVYHARITGVDGTAGVTIHVVR
jgi:subtilisin family serine protease